MWLSTTPTEEYEEWIGHVLSYVGRRIGRFWEIVGEIRVGEGKKEREYDEVRWGEVNNEEGIPEKIGT